MSPPDFFVACDSCGGRTIYAGHVSPLGDSEGARIYHCPSCKRLTWAPWHREPPAITPQPSPKQPSQQQPTQQQQQPQKRKPGDSEN